MYRVIGTARKTGRDETGENKMVKIKVNDVFMGKGKSWAATEALLYLKWAAKHSHGIDVYSAKVEWVNDPIVCAA